VHRLRLNPDKTVVMWLGSKHQVEKITVHDIPVLQSSTTTVDIARDLGVLLDSQFTMSEQVYVGTSRRCMSISIQLSSPAPPCRSSAVGRSKEDGSPRICVFVQSTTATLCCSVLPTVLFNVFKLFKMLLHVSSV